VFEWVYNAVLSVPPKKGKTFSLNFISGGGYSDEVVNHINAKRSKGKNNHWSAVFVLPADAGRIGLCTGLPLYNHERPAWWKRRSQWRVIL
jgi:hypothetical protein